MDLLEIRKKAKQRKRDDAAAAPARDAAPAAHAAPAAVEKPVVKPVEMAKPAQAPKAVEPEITPESFEAFLKQSGFTDAPASPPAPAPPTGIDLDLKQLAPQAAEPGRGLDSMFLDLATEELYRHSYLADAVADDAAQQHEILTCMLATEVYGIDIHRIKEIIKLRDITEVPRAPRFVLGIITLRGRVIPVFDLRERMGLEKRPLGREAKIVVVHHKLELYGLVVDAVIDVARFPERSIEATPPVMGGVEAKFIEGIGRAGEQMIILLNLDEVINLEVASAA